MKSVLKYISCLIGVLFVTLAITVLFEYVNGLKFRYFLHDFSLYGLVGSFFLWLVFMKKTERSHKFGIGHWMIGIGTLVVFLCILTWDDGTYDPDTEVVNDVNKRYHLHMMVPEHENPDPNNTFNIIGIIGGAILIIMGISKSRASSNTNLPPLATPPTNSKSIEERLHQLNGLRSKQLISDSEYEQRRKDIVASL